MDMMVYQTGFGMLPKAVMQSPNLKIESKAIFAYLTTFAGNGDTAFPGRELICKDLGISKDRFYKYMNELKEKGYTTREIEVLSGISKSQVSRELKEEK